MKSTPNIDTDVVPVMRLFPPPQNLIAHIEPGDVALWKGYTGTVEAIAGEYVRLAVPISNGRVTVHVIGKAELHTMED